MNMANMPMSNSEIQTWKQCHRKWWLQYYRNFGSAYVTGMTGASFLGTKVHDALDGHYGHQMDPVILIKDIYKLELDQLDPIDDEFRMRELLAERDLAVLMIEGYMDWIKDGGEDSNLEIIASEKTIRIPSMVDGYDLVAKLDIMAKKLSDGRVVFMDHKTKMSLTEPLKTIDLLEQFRMYAMLLKLLNGTDVDGGIINMLRKVKRTARATPPFYSRVEVRVNRHQLNSMWHRIEAVINEIDAARTALDNGGNHLKICYPNPADDCSWKCPFLAVCPMFDDGSRAEDYVENNYVQIDPYARYHETSMIERVKEERIAHGANN
jgi:hypothetical protein